MVAGFLGVDSRGQSAQRGVRPVVVVVDPPGLDQGSRFGQGGEQVLVEALVPQPPVEALHEPVLLRLARCDVMSFDPARFLPAQDGVARQLGAIVGNDHRRPAAPGDDPVQFAADPHA